MSNIFKQNEIRATFALAIVSIAFAELSARSPESSRPVLVIIATALGMAAMYPLFLLLQRPRRYRITKVTEGYETVYIIRYKGYLWWYSATLSNGRITMDVLTDLPGVQCYTSGFLAHTENPLSGGVIQHRRMAIALETQVEPDAPSRGENLLKAGAKYDTMTVYRFS